MPIRACHSFFAARARCTMTWLAEAEKVLMQSEPPRYVVPGKAGTEAAVKELGHGVEAVAEVKRQENPEQCVEADEDRAPFGDHRDKAAVVGRAHRADQVMAGDVGRDDAAADDPPGELVARE